MIQVYCAGNTNYENNGDIVLLPTSCQLSCGINDTWELAMEHPVDFEGRWKYLDAGAVLAVPTFQSEKQLFRITKCERNESTVSATAYPIFFDSANDCFLMDTRPTDKDGQEALDILTSGSKYSAESNITTHGTAYFVRRNLMDAINGEADPTFIGVWGGEILFDNYKVIINTQIGTDNGLEIRYGKNMNGLQYSVDMSEVVTRIIPVAYNGYMMDGNTPWIDSENIEKYPVICTREVKFEDVKMAEDASESEEETSDIICNTQAELNVALTQKCQDMYSAGADLPSVTINVNLIDLEHTEQYKDFSGLVSVGLGDTVHCYNNKLDLSTDARVIQLKWDCIRNQASELTLGNYEYNYFSSLTSSMQAVSQVIGPGNTVMADRVQGILNAMTTQFRAQKNIAQAQDVRAMLFEDLDPTSPTFGAMCLGTQGLQIAHERNATNSDWEWGTAINFKTVNANQILTGKISSRTGAVYFDLDANNGKGELAASILKGVEEGSTTTARVGIGTYSGGTTYEGVSVQTSSGAGSAITLALDRSVGNYSLANDSEIFSYGNLTIRSQAISTNPGGNNSINLYGNSGTGEGLVEIRRGTPDGSEQVLYAKEDQTALLHKGEFVFVVDDIALNIRYKQDNIMIGQDDATIIRFQDNDRVKVYQDLIQFVTGGYARASIENDGAYFADLYSNGSLVTSDRKKKANIKKFPGGALDKVKGSPVYRYKLKKELKPDGTSAKAKAKTITSDKESIGLIYDEAPEEIRRESAKGDKAIDLYGMVSILWKAVQELSDKIETMSAKLEVSKE